MKRMSKILKKALSILVSMAVLITAIPGLDVFASETVTLGITVTNGNVKAGEYVTVYVKANDFANIGALETAVYYDADVLTVNSTWGGALANGTVMDINDSEEGMVKMTLASAEGISGNGTLLGITFLADTDAKPGDYQLRLAVSDIYDLEFNSITVSRTSGVISISEAGNVVKTVSFYSSLSSSQVEEGEGFTYTLSSGDIGSLAGGDFKVEYDKNILEVVDVTLCDAMCKGNYVYDINDKTAGIVRITYASNEAIDSNWSELYKIKFKAKKAAENSEIKYSTSGLTDVELNAMKGNILSDTVTVISKQEEPVYPEFILSGSDEVSAGETIEITASIPGESLIAAGDFIITYDTDYLKCIEVTEDKELVENGGIIVTKEDIGNGQICFSYVNTKPSAKDTALVHMTFAAKEKTYGSTEISVKGKDVVNASYKDVTLEYPSKTIEVKVKCEHSYNNVITKPNCTEGGYTTHTCSRCGDSYKDSETSALGHTEEVDEAVEAACTKTGLTAGSHCSVCSEVLEKQEEIPALGHDYKAEVTKPTCDKAGYTTHTCSRCDDRYTDSETPAAGHTEVVDEAVEPTCTETGLTAGSHCSVCSEVLEKQEELPALGHDYKAEITSPTCDKAGYTTHTCSRCDDSYTDSETSATGHSFGPWEQTKAPTETEPGEKARICSVCQHKETAEIPVLSDDGLWGDGNSDNKVNVKDAVIVLQYANRKISADALDLTVSDVNGDGKVNVKDATLILQYANKKLDKFPVEEK